MCCGSDLVRKGGTERPSRCHLNHVTGYDAFRMEQQGAVLSLLRGHDTMVIMPTGGGKSMCYMLPAVMYPGTAVVICPLLALMQDQLAALEQLGIRAAAINSVIKKGQRQATLAALHDPGDNPIKLLFTTPESLSNEECAHAAFWPTASRGISSGWRRRWRSCTSKTDCRFWPWTKPIASAAGGMTFATPFANWFGAQSSVVVFAKLLCTHLAPHTPSLRHTLDTTVEQHLVVVLQSPLVLVHNKATTCPLRARSVMTTPTSPSSL